MWEQSAEFWSQRDAWRAKVAASAKGRRAAWNPIAQEARWAIQADHYLRKLPQVRAAVSFNQEAVRQAVATNLERVAPELAAAFDARLPLVAAAAFGAWPVQSGFSKGSLQLYYRGDGETFTGGIAVTAPYATLIKGGPAQRLIGGPVRRVLPEILTDWLRRMEARS